MALIAAPDSVTVTFVGYATAAMSARAADGRRRKLISSYGDVFTVKHAVELATIAPR